VRAGAGAIGVAGMTVVGGRITDINLILDPDKLRSLVFED
jgi:hypothetical protein